MSNSVQFPFVVLRARDHVRGESLNAGIVLFAFGRAIVGVTPDTARLKAMHPDYAALRLGAWARDLEKALAEYADKLPEVSQQIALLPLLAHPFTPDPQPGFTDIDGANPEATLATLMRWQVLPQKRTLKVRREKAKRATRLAIELRQWLKHAKAFSTNIEDLSRHRVVANYPIDPSADLYADLAVMNGRLNVMEVMDLRGVEKLTASARGEAAVKGITLDEAKRHANAVAVVAASDYAAAKPAIHLMSRYANELFDLGSMSERDRFASFIATSLHRNDLLSESLTLRDQ